VNPRFGGTYHFQLQDKKSALKRAAISQKMAKFITIAMRTSNATP
jgi:hypothetical protein